MNMASFLPSDDMTIVSGNLSRAFVGHFKRSAAENCAADADGILDGETLTAAAKTVKTFLAQPSCAKNITVVGGAAGMAGTVTVSGKNIDGDDISEEFTLSGTSAQTGNKAFASITSIALPARTAAGDTVDVGWGTKLGLPVAMSQNLIIKSLRDTSTSDSGTFTAADAVESCTYVAGAQGKTLDLWLILN